MVSITINVMAFIKMCNGVCVCILVSLYDSYECIHHVCVCVYIYIYIHTHIYIYICVCVCNTV